ncbi:MAG TPA: hypothetical protein IGS37_04300 [Synechococcales cyanobacterium M55_K2018_004]|nr:hypothetical protein [Synechococcales cyanobacterium M55_K2018_004]
MTEQQSLENSAPNSNSECQPQPRNPLRPNPFTTYRDPQTGQWIVVKRAIT